MTENLRQRDGDQPLPTEGKLHVQDALIDLIKQRRQLGIERYGRPLQTFNGRNAVLDLIEELLDGATYAMQVEMEIKATQARIRETLHIHRADDSGLCVSCETPSPCPTRHVLVGVAPAAKPEDKLTVEATHPIGEVAVHPDSLDAFKAMFNVNKAEERLGAPLLPGPLFGIPVLCDDSVPPGVVRMRPQGFDNHPSHGPKE